MNSDTGWSLRRVAYSIALILLLSSMAPAGPLNLKVVYPKPNQNIAAVDSNFIFGSVTPGSNLVINGQLVKVHKDGGWLAFLPVNPGPFDFFLQAEKGGLTDTLTVTVNLPVLPRYSYDSLYFVPGSFKPAGPLWVRSGDAVEISFAATPYCNAFCVIANTGDTIPMIEMPPQNYYRGESVFERGDEAISPTPDSLLIRGIYRGSLIVPDIKDDSLRLIYGIYPPSFMQMTWLIRYASELKTTPLAIHDLGSLPALKIDTSKTPIRILNQNPPMMAELIDSLTVIRTGPGKGYLCIFQPAGIRAEIAGLADKWIKLKLSDYQYGWIPDTAAVILPEGTPPDNSYISRLTTVNYPDKVAVIVATSARHPFRVVEDIDEHSITLFLYGADSDTDWIRYDNSDALIDHIVWFQPEPGVYGLEIFLTEARIWGYDAYYVEKEFHFDLKKFPKKKNDISDFRFVIDPGHGPDPGAVGPTGLTEKEANLKIALRLKRDLEHEGAEVILTRSSDTTLPLYERPKIAVRDKADIFISIHNNALPDGSNPFANNGVSTFYYNPHSAALARAVQRALSRKIKLNDFGWYYGNLAVDRPTQYPAILVECAFMMIPEQEAMLKTDKFRKKISRGIIDGIKDFLRGRPRSIWDRDRMDSYGW